MIFYSDNEVKMKLNIDFSKMNGTKKSLEHYSNLLILQEMLRCGKYVAETIQITHEIKLCERKIEWWKRYNFNQNDFVRGCEELKRLWRK